MTEEVLRKLLTYIDNVELIKEASYKNSYILNDIISVLEGNFVGFNSRFNKTQCIEIAKKLIQAQDNERCSILLIHLSKEDVLNTRTYEQLLMICDQFNKTDKLHLSSVKEILEISKYLTFQEEMKAINSINNNSKMVGDILYKIVQKYPDDFRENKNYEQFSNLLMECKNEERLEYIMKNLDYKGLDELDYRLPWFNQIINLESNLKAKSIAIVLNLDNRFYNRQEKENFFQKILSSDNEEDIINEVNKSKDIYNKRVVEYINKTNMDKKDSFKYGEENFSEEQQAKLRRYVGDVARKFLSKNNDLGVLRKLDEKFKELTSFKQVELIDAVAANNEVIEKRDINFMIDLMDFIKDGYNDFNMRQVYNLVVNENLLKYRNGEEQLESIKQVTFVPSVSDSLYASNILINKELLRNRTHEDVMKMVQIYKKYNKNTDEDINISKVMGLLILSPDVIKNRTADEQVYFLQQLDKNSDDINIIRAMNEIFINSFINQNESFEYQTYISKLLTSDMTLDRVNGLINTAKSLARNKKIDERGKKSLLAEVLYSDNDEEATIKSKLIQSTNELLNAEQIIALLNLQENNIEINNQASKYMALLKELKLIHDIKNANSCQMLLDTYEEDKTSSIRK